MSVVEMILIGVSLSMDAFAVSICKGLSMKKASVKWAVIMGLFFGGSQALMPAIGWFLGKQFEGYITSVDHWVAFGLLAFIGGKMVFDTLKGDGEDERCQIMPNLKEVAVLAVATSIDALAVGISFAFIEVNVWQAVIAIGLVTFVMSVVGVLAGSRFGEKVGSRANLVGGVVLVLIGLKILLQDLGVL